MRSGGKLNASDAYRRDSSGYAGERTSVFASQVHKIPRAFADGAAEHSWGAHRGLEELVSSERHLRR
jgi:hypothetical protein